MKKIKVLLCLALCAAVSHAQVLYNSGAVLSVKTGSILQVNGAAQFQSGSTLTNDGSLIVKGNIISNQTMTAANAGTLTLDGTSAQTLSGSGSYFAKNVTINNANGVTLNMPLKLDGVFNFNNGILNAATVANAVTFTTNASVSGTNVPKNSSHINGYAVKEGTGSFTYPVGDGISYEPVSINLSANAGGMRVRYHAADAGTGIFTTGGSEAVALASYSTQEYWDASPITTATGTVQIFWDGYKDSYSNPVNQRRVAHKVGGNWLNEGSALSATGTISTGSVMSNSISSWSPFALGSVVSVLPVNMISISGSLVGKMQAKISWTAEEINVISYAVEKSADGISFSKIADAAASGNGINKYDFFDPQFISKKTFYRVRLKDAAGKYIPSSVTAINAGNEEMQIAPNPFAGFVKINSVEKENAVLYDAAGKALLTLRLNAGINTINTSGLNPGTYIFKTVSGKAYRLIKESSN